VGRNLKAASFENCKTVIAEFLDAVPVEGRELEEKKERAGAALDTIAKLFNGESMELDQVGAMQDERGKDGNGQEATGAGCACFHLEE
jgi:hypothetical protein